MSQNNLIEVGSKADVILRFRQETIVNGETYSANEPYLLFKNANVSVSYSNEDKAGSAARTVIANSEINPRIISVGSVNLTRKLVSLLTSFSSQEQDFGLTTFETRSPEEVNENLQIILNEDVLSGTENKIFVYEEDEFNKIEFTYDAATNRITSPNFEINKRYLISYASELSGIEFTLNKNHIPYLSLEIQGVGNIDKKKKNVVMYFDKVSLTSSIDFNFIQDDMISVPLIFNIIENKNNYIWIEN